MKPWAVIDSATHTVQNTCAWDGISEWHPPRGCFVVDLSNQIVQPSVGWRWLATTKTFAPPVEMMADGKHLLLPDGSVYKPQPVVVCKQTVETKPVDPMKLPHREINWTLCDQGKQSPEIFRPGRETAEIYADRMKLEAFQYKTPKTEEKSVG
jgi:hypothetical protein